MSLVIITGTVLAGLTCWFLPAFTKLPRVQGPTANPIGAGSGFPGDAAPEAARRRGAGQRWFRPRGPAAGMGVDDHVELMRQLAALLRSGRHPGEVWMLLETTWGMRIPQAEGQRKTARGPRRGWRNQRAATTTAARDIMAACRAARISHETGSGPSSGIERHQREQPEFSHAWQRLLWCIRLSESTGAPLGELLQRLADQLEAEQDRRRALEAALAGPRMTQKLLAWLPALGLGLAQLMGADPLGVLTGTALGRMCLVAGGALWGANALWSRHLLAAARPPTTRRRLRGSGRRR